MPFYNTYPGFLYRQFFICPSKALSSVSLYGQTGLITGSNTGLGYHAASQLLSLGLTRLIMGVQNASKGEAARKQLLDSLPKLCNPPVVEVWELDLACYSSIITFVDCLKQSGIILDFAILNAGVASFNFRLNKSTGNKDSIQINWLSTALMTLLLLHMLDQQAAAHVNRARPTISIVGSETAAWAKFKEAQIATKQRLTLLETLNSEKYFNMTDWYYTSKLLYQLSFLELLCNHQSSTNSLGAVLNLVNPSFCYGSELHRSAEGALDKVLGGVKRVVGRSVSMGARTLVHAAVLAGPEFNSKYLSDNQPAPFAGYSNSYSGWIMQGKVWDEMVMELSQVVNTAKLLSKI